MKRKWSITLTAFFISGGFALSAFLYHPPAEITLLMREVLLRAEEWNIHMQGMVGVLPIQGDVVGRKGGQQLLRVSYDPLKRINNQWIVLDGQYGSGGLDFFNSLVLKKRLSFTGEDTRQFTRYSFIVAPSTLALFPDVVSAEGEIWFPRRPTSWAPSRVLLAMHTKSASDVKIDLAVQYVDLFNEVYPAPADPRPLSVVLDQLAGGPDSQAQLLLPLPTLKDELSSSQAFSSDFDQDELPDALELFYGTDPANPDSDNDTFSDGEEVSRGYNPAGAGQLD